MSKTRLWSPRVDPRDYKVDVLVVVYNHERTLSRCLDSILAQNHRNLSVTVVDDCSTDRSWRVAKSYETRFQGRLVVKKTEVNRGGGIRAREECGFSPTGDFWAIIEGDDWWLSSSKITNQINLIHRDKRLVGSSGTTLQVGPRGEKMSSIAPSLKSWAYLDWVVGEQSLYVHMSSLLWKNIFSGKEGFLPHLLSRGWPRGEWAMTLACLAESGGKLAHLDEVVSQYNFHGKGTWSSRTADLRNLKNRALQADLRSRIPVKYKFLSKLRTAGLK